MQKVANASAENTKKIGD